MRQLFGYLRDYFREDCNWAYFLLLAAFVAAGIGVNFFVLSEDDWIKLDPVSSRRLAKYLAGYLVVFGGAYALQMLADRDPRLRNPTLWGLIIFAILLFSVRAWYRPDPSLISDNVAPQYGTLVYKLIINLTGFVTLFLPCALYWLMADRSETELYGFRAKGVKLWPYFILIGLMVPVLFAAGAQPDFQRMYPRAARLWIPEADPNLVAGTMLYEIVYSIDYVVTEFFFRGFLIIPFARIIGAKAILPMCAFYVAIHFDKPLGECISSFFGGLLLGILAYRTQSIYGGVIVHLGIALGMELVGWWYLKGL